MLLNIQHDKPSASNQRTVILPNKHPAQIYKPLPISTIYRVTVHHILLKESTCLNTCTCTQDHDLHKDLQGRCQLKTKDLLNLRYSRQYSNYKHVVFVFYAQFNLYFEMILKVSVNSWHMLPPVLGPRGRSHYEPIPCDVSITWMSSMLFVTLSLMQS